MKRFPGEEERSQEVQVILREQFRYAQRIYDRFADMEMDSWFRRSDIEHDVAQVVLMLQMQVCRLYRVIFEQCQRGEGFCARITLRSLYETIMAMEFVLKPEICIRAKIKKDGTGKPKLDRRRRPVAHAQVVPPSRANKKERLSRLFRATLYRARPVFRAEYQADEWRRTRRLQKFRKVATQKVDRRSIKYFEERLPPEWCHIVGQRSYSGLHISDLVGLLDPMLQTWYETIYGLDCEISHGGAAHLHVSEDGTELVGFSSDSTIFVTLQCAACLFYGSLQLMQENIYFGRDHERLLNALEEDYRKVFHKDKVRALRLLDDA